MWRNWRIDSHLKTNRVEKHIIYDSLFLVVAIFDTFSIDNMCHPIDSITVHNMPSHVLLTAYQTRILYNSFSLPIYQLNEKSLPKSSLHIVVFIIKS